MRALHGHPVVTIDDKCGIVIHQVNHFPDKVLRQAQFALNLRVFRAEGVPSTVHSDHVYQHEVKVRSVLELSKHMFRDVQVESVHIVDVKAVPVSVARPPLPELVRPDVVSVEKNSGLAAQLRMHLVK